MTDIIELSADEWKGYELRFSYVTDGHYRVRVGKTGDGWNVSLKLERFAPVGKSFESELFEPHWDDASAFGIFDGGELAAVLEVQRENWSKRLRVTELLVMEKYRRKGLGARLMNKAKEVAEAEGFRAVILETQTCNLNAIAFYLAQGFVFGGLDVSAYSFGNDDIERREVRLELVYFMNGGKI